MNNLEIFSNAFIRNIRQATDRLRQCNFTDAYRLIVEAIRINPDAPQPHNLLGIWFELNEDGDKARKHYRAAYALDPTFRPACKNLERICTMSDCGRIPYDFGDEPEEDSKRLQL
jgi:Flp pilus assembly protein TadD